MPDSNTTTLRSTPFDSFHKERGAKLVDFTGWSMPLHYGSIIAEHEQVRTSGGLFDVSHMGRLAFSGRDARAFLDRICTRQILGMADGQARYSLICNERGGCRDDVLVYKLADARYLMVCNAANRTKLLEHFDEVRGSMVFDLKDQTEGTAMIALQGPKVMDLLSDFSNSIPALKRYRFLEKNLLVAKILISRTGYTGEDGVEVILPAALAKQAIGMMLKNVDLDSDTAVVKPAGLGARDSLRLEAGMALYGHEITEDIDPVSAGLGFAMKLTKGDDDAAAGRFIGQDALQAIAADGPARRLVGLKLEGRRSARQDMNVMHGTTVVGTVTSGCASPTLGYCIAMAYVDSALAEPGNAVEVDLGRTTTPATVVALPFYKC